MRWCGEDWVIDYRGILPCRGWVGVCMHGLVFSGGWRIVGTGRICVLSLFIAAAVSCHCSLVLTLLSSA